jgi:ACT domain-containing protein
MRAIITVIGKDKVGITAGVSSVLADNKINILDISQTVMQEYFTMMMLVDLSSMEINMTDLKDLLTHKGQELGVSIKVQHEDIFQSMHRI